MQRDVVELHLALDPGGLDDAEPVGQLGGVFEQCGLPDSWLAVHHEHCASTFPCLVQQPLEYRNLALPAQQRPAQDPPDPVTARTIRGSNGLTVRPRAARLRVSGIRTSPRKGDDLDQPRATPATTEVKA